MRCAFIDEDDAIRHLIDLGGIGRVHHARHAGRQAEAFRVVLHIVLQVAFFPDGFRRGLERDLDETATIFVMRVGLEVHDVGHIPDPFAQAAEVGFTGLDAVDRLIGDARHRRLSSRGIPAPPAATSAGGGSRCSGSRRGTASTTAAAATCLLSGLRGLALSVPIRRGRATRGFGSTASALGGCGNGQQAQARERGRRRDHRIHMSLQVETSSKRWLGTGQPVRRPSKGGIISWAAWETSADSHRRIHFRLSR